MLAWSISRILSDKQQAATCSLVMDLAFGSEFCCGGANDDGLSGGFAKGLCRAFGGDFSDGFGGGLGIV